MSDSGYPASDMSSETYADRLPPDVVSANQISGPMSRHSATSLTSISRPESYNYCPNENTGRTFSHGNNTSHKNPFQRDTPAFSRGHDVSQSSISVGFKRQMSSKRRAPPVPPKPTATSTPCAPRRMAIKQPDSPHVAPKQHLPHDSVSRESTPLHGATLPGVGQKLESSHSEDTGKSQHSETFNENNKIGTVPHSNLPVGYGGWSPHKQKRQTPPASVVQNEEDRRTVCIHLNS